MLNEIRILEFGDFVAAPAAGMLMGDLGAQVIKVERPDGDPLWSWPAYEVWNRNKQVRRLDVRSNFGLKEALDLIAGADVVLEGWKPGFLERAGIRPKELLEAHKQLIWCSIPPFAPELGVPGYLGWEPIISAMTGMHGNRRGSGQPAFTPLPFASMFAALLAATSVSAALVSRANTGRGQFVEVPIHSAAFFPMGFNLLRVDGAAPQRATSGPGLIPLVAPYRCADGRWIFFNNTTPRMQRALIAGLGLHEWVEEGLLGPDRRPLDANKAKTLHERLTALFLTREALEWETQLSELGLSCVVCRNVEEWLSHPHARDAGLVVEAPSRFGPLRQPGALVLS